MRLIVLLFAAITVLMPCDAAEVIFIQSGQSPQLLENCRNLAGFYGLSLKSIDASAPGGVASIMARLESKPRPVAVIAVPQGLARLDRAKVLAALRQPGAQPVPLLVYGVTSADSPLLGVLSGRMISGCDPLPGSFRPAELKVGQSPSITKPLSGRQLPSVARPVCRLEFDSSSHFEPIVTAGEQDRAAVLLLRSNQAGEDLFLAPQTELFDTSWMGSPTGVAKAFSSIAPLAFFLSYAAGDYAWHLDGHYANLTIDDPWLTRSYGHLNYRALLDEMNKHNFHTTIAFIPWNFDRSEPSVVSLFLENPKRFSICIHGNNHAHQEFGDYSSYPLSEQIADIKQSVARMERFQALTGISYDRFMVFPHSVAPERTFAALKQYGFLGTANSLNVPLGDAYPKDPVFLLRPYTLRYAGFLSMFRYPVSAQIPQTAVAVQSFLGNPVLFYSHEDLFDNGINAFDKVADFVNRVQPDTQWVSLGEIARHLYLLRRRADGGFDVRMFSNEMDLRNPIDKEAVFHIEYGVASSSSLPTVFVDRVPAAFEHSQNALALRLVIPAGQTRRIRIIYPNDLELSKEDLGKDSWRVWLIRHGSDFRDIYLSRVSWGRSLTRMYYKDGWNDVEVGLERRWPVLACLCILLSAGWYFRRKRRKVRIGKMAESNLVRSAGR